MIPPPERPRFYNARAKVRRALALVSNEGKLGFTLARRSWLWVVHGPGRIVGDTVLRRVVLGVPAAAVAATAVTVLALNPKADQNKFRSRYRTDAESALAAGQWQEAYVRYQRLAVDAGYTADDVYGLARALEGEGQAEEANTLFERVAPDSATGQPEAHFRRAMQLIFETPPDVRRAEGHLLRAVHARPNYAEARAVLGQLRLNAGDADGALPHLLAAVQSHPELSLPLAQVFTGRDVDAAGRWAAEAVDHFGPPAKARPEDADAQFSYAKVLHLAQRHRDAADVIRTALARKEDPRLRQLAGDVYADWCLTLTGDGRADERFRRIEEGLDLSPGAGPLLQGLAAAAAGTGPLAITAQVAAARRITAGGPTAIGLRLAFGIEAAKRGKVVEARRFIADAYQADPNSPVVANNLACMLILDPDADPARALTIINAALKDRNEEPNLRDTRGQVLVRLGRWREAAGDLEFALSRIPANRETHRALAQAYRGMNLATLADAQDRKAAELPK